MKSKKRKIQYVDQETQTQLITPNGVDILENTGNKGTVLAIHEIKKYRIETSIKIFMETNSEVLYDILLTDGEKAIACLLSPELNYKITKYELHIGCTIKLLNFTKKINEKITGGRKFIIINEIEKVSDFCSTSFEIPTFLVSPILKQKEFYYPLYDDDNFTDEKMKEIEYWEPSLEKPKFTLKQIQKTGKKSIILGRKDHKCPLNFQILLGDDETEVPVTFWNRLALEYYHSINIGDILLISGYRMKDEIKKSIFGSFKVEFSLNENKAQIYKLATYGEEEFARVHFNFKTTNEITELEDGTIFDFIGTIINISDYERVQDSFGNFSQFRWITFLDSRSPTFFKCKVFTNSQKKKMDELRVSDICLLTELKLKVISETENERQFYGITSFISSIFDEIEIETMLDVQDEPEDSLLYINCSKLDKWRSRNNQLMSQFMRNESQFSFPLLDFSSFEKRKEQFPFEELIFFNEIQPICEKLEYLETRSVFIQAIIKEIHIGKEREMDKYSDKGAIKIKSRKKLKLNEKEVQNPEVDVVQVKVFLQDLNEEEVIEFTYPIWNKFNIEYQLCELIQDGNIDKLTENLKNCIGKKYFFSVFLKRVDDVTFIKMINSLWISKNSMTETSQEIND
eukprot:gene11195-4015_t